MYEVDRNSDVPLYIQIRNAIEQAIEGGHLQPGDRLPSVASLAKEIGVTQATVRRALQDLAEAGRTDSHVGRGTFIRETGSAEEGKGQDAYSALPLPDTVKISATRRMRSGVSKALYDIMPLAHKPGVIQLTQGVPDPHLLPERFLEDVCNEVMAEGSSHLIQATEPQGHYALRAEIARRASVDGLMCPLSRF